MTSDATPADAAPAVGTTEPRAYALAIWGLVAIGVGLRVWEFAGFSSLWFDEINLARNIAERSYAGLLRPLDYGQVAPAGFLFAERLLWSLFHTDWSLRLIPLCGAIAAVFLFRALARRVLTGIAVPIAVAAFALGEVFIAWGSQFKQYSTDVALALVILLMTSRLLESTEVDRGRRRALAGLAGFVAVWFSNAAVLVVAGVGAALAVLVLAGRVAEGRRLCLVTLLPWAAGSAMAVVLSERAVSAQTMAYMHVYWDTRFAPWPPWTGASLMWYWRALHGVFGGSDGLRYAPVVAWVCTLLAFGGFVVLWRARNHMALVLAGPLVAALGAAAARLYPFGGRLILYLTPIFILTAAAAGAGTVEWLGRRSRLAAGALALAMFTPPLVRIAGHLPIYQDQQVRQQFEWLARHRRPDDVVLVWYWAAPAFAWYADRYGLAAGQIVAGGCWPAEPRGFLRDLDQLRGRSRVWLLVEAGYRPEAKLMFDYADRIGTRLEGISLPPGVETWLYDFSDSTKLGRAAAATFLVPPTSPSQFHLMSCPLGLFTMRADTAAGRQR